MPKTAQVPEIRLGPWLDKVSDLIPALFSMIRSKELRRDEVWGNILPFSSVIYGGNAETSSLGHVVRLDVVLPEDDSLRPQIVEYDCVPSYRHVAMACLNDEERQQQLASWKDWYSSLGPEKVFCVARDGGTCWRDTEAFVDLLRESGLDIESCSIEDAEERIPPGSLVDRIFDLGETNKKEPLPQDVFVVTKESYLDSKAGGALIHHKESEPFFEGVFDKKQLSYLRSIFPESHMLELLHQSWPDWYLEELLEWDRLKSWILKATCVGTDYSAGSKGVSLGIQHRNKGKLRRLFALGVPPSERKQFGPHPMLQRFVPSRDFSDLWNGIVAGEYRKVDMSRYGWNVDEEKTSVVSDKKVSARLGVFLLVSNVTETCTALPFAPLTLRADPLVHGSSDALNTVCRVY